MGGLAIGYADETEAEAMRRAEPYAGKSYPVIVDGERSRSVRAAAREIGCAPKTLMDALENGRGMCKGRTVSYARKRDSAR